MIPAAARYLYRSYIVRLIADSELLIGLVAISEFQRGGDTPRAAGCL